MLPSPGPSFPSVHPCHPKGHPLGQQVVEHFVALRIRAMHLRLLHLRGQAALGGQVDDLGLATEHEPVGGWFTDSADQLKAAQMGNRKCGHQMWIALAHKAAGVQGRVLLPTRPCSA